MPYGGKYQLTETQTMVAKLPVANGKCDTVTMMSYGFDPYLSSWSPYHGADYAVLHRFPSIVTAGGDLTRFVLHSRNISAECRRNQALEPAICSTAGAYMHRLVSDFHPSVERTACPVPSMILMFRQHWYPLQLM